MWVDGECGKLECVWERGFAVGAGVDRGLEREGGDRSKQCGMCSVALCCD